MAKTTRGARQHDYKGRAAEEIVPLSRPSLNGGG
jgi:hypothetical protein